MDPYDKYDLEHEEMYSKTSIIEGEISAVMDFELLDRSFELISSPTRVFRTHDIHEFIIVGDVDSDTSQSVTGATYVGFVEITSGGLAVVGNSVLVNGEVIGEIVGFDRTHCPNHLNVVCSGERITGDGRGICCGDSVQIC